MPPWRHTAVAEQNSISRSPSPYQPGTVTRRQRVQHGGKEDADGEEVEPAEAVENGGLQGLEDLAGTVRENNPDGKENANGGDGTVEDQWADDEALEHAASLDAESPAAACTGAGIVAFRNANVPNPGEKRRKQKSSAFK
jgi:hypothetical protein